MDEEALELLKKYYQEGQLDKIKPDGANLVFGGDKSFPKKLKIERFTGKYDLHSIFHLVKHNYPEKRSTEYFQEGKEEGVIFLSAVHIPEVYEFLRSKRETENDSIPGILANNLLAKRTRESESSNNIQPQKKFLLTTDSLKPIELSDEAKKSKDAFLQMIEFKKPHEEDTSNDVKESLYIDTTRELTKMIIDREKIFQNRNTILQSPTKQFQSIIETVRDHIQTEKLEERRRRDEKKRQEAGYDRYNSNNEAIWKDHHLDIQELKIDPMGSFSKQGLSIPPISKSILNTKLQTSSSSSMNNNNNNYSSSSSSSAYKDKSRRSREMIPIIIIPSAVTSILSLQNFKSFVENGVLNQVEKQVIAKKPSSILVSKPTTKGQKSSNYFVIDNPSKMKEADWERVVAVFALGAEWQFKDWKWSTPVEVFSHAKGFYLTYDDTPVPDKILSWDVKILKVNRHQLHTVKQAQLLFWDLLELGTVKSK